MNQPAHRREDASFDVTVTDSRRAVAYLIAPEADDYIAIMAVLESSLTDLTPAEVATGPPPGRSQIGTHHHAGPAPGPGPPPHRPDGTPVSTRNALAGGLLDDDLRPPAGHPERFGSR